MQRPAQPGRYGAIVRVTPENGWPFTRFVTLYRVSPGFNWQLATVDVPAFPLPAELQLDPKVVAEQASNLSAFTKEQLFVPYPSYGEHQAILLAGLSELKATGGQATVRTGPKALDKQWWYEQKKMTGDLRQDYYVHLPAGYEADPGKKWPLLLFLHGSGQRGDKLKDILVTGVVQDLDKKPDFPAIVIAPQCLSTEDWSAPELNDLLDRAEAKYHVDLDRVYLTGLSMGGFGAWTLAIASPERFAALVPICGGGDPADVARLKAIPTWVFHGANDNIVSPQLSQRMVDALQAAGGDVKYTLFPNMDHGSWNKAYAMPELYEWLWQQRRAGK